uniref:Uncharacterized protein n=1 Tax=Candidatus Kentrum sp. TC TaxID=2126339 RepID=A0A451A9F7_9GAMM|nr:MAG: hypothetical protein BECKTC1821F_GA0114240_107812 [Candidatus Kentron sp. TC]
MPICICAMYKGTNRYYKNSKISEAKFRQIAKAFAMDFRIGYRQTNRLKHPFRQSYLPQNACLYRQAS